MADGKKLKAYVKQESAASTLQTGAKGGSFYITANGTKIYRKSAPGFSRLAGESRGSKAEPKHEKLEPAPAHKEVVAKGNKDVDRKAPRDFGTVFKAAGLEQHHTGDYTTRKDASGGFYRKKYDSYGQRNAIEHVSGEARPVQRRPPGDAVAGADSGRGRDGRWAADRAGAGA